jgi:hypothetical protein
MAALRPWPLTEAVLALARKAQGAQEPVLVMAGRQAEERLRQPLCAAVVGHVSAGKSTLLNALLETAVAPTAGNECTQVLYAFRHDRWKTATVLPRAGVALPPERAALPFAGDGLSPDLPLPAPQIDRIEVTLPSEMLEQVTLLDTPGLASTNSETSAVTRDLLESSTLGAARTADAIIFCINTALMDAEAEAVSLFRSGKARLHLTGGTAVAVLTKVDQPASGNLLLRDRGVVWQQAATLARSLATRHADLFADVIPVIGKLAETAQTGVVREHHARLLRDLARAWPPELARVVLTAEQLFYEEPAPVENEQRRELVQLFDMYGIAIMLDALRAGMPATAAEVTRLALQESGFADVEKRLRIQLGSRADVLKAGAQLNILLDTAQAARNADVYSTAQELLDKPEMFDLKVFGLARLLASGKVKPPPGLADQAWTLVSTGLPHVSGHEAANRVREWRGWAMLADGEGQSFARIMVQAWQLAAQGR